MWTRRGTKRKTAESDLATAFAAMSLRELFIYLAAHPPLSPADLEIVRAAVTTREGETMQASHHRHENVFGEYSVIDGRLVFTRPKHSFYREMGKTFVRTMWEFYDAPLEIFQLAHLESPHRTGGPAETITTVDDALLIFERWIRLGIRHRAGAPAETKWYLRRRGELKLRSRKWFVRGVLHHETGPAVEKWWEHGMVKMREWWLHGQRSRADGPAVERFDKHGRWILREWWDHGQLTRADGPARVTRRPDYGVKTKEWFLNGLRHRDGGPAVITTHRGDITRQEWYNHGQLIRAEEFESSWP